LSQNNSTLLDPAISTFADLQVRPSTRDALLRMNISEPTRIQADTLPLLLAGRDVIGQSRTGSGKTLAFGIPAVEVVDSTLRGVQVLVLTPTRELAVQVGSVFSQLVEGTGIRVALVYGGRALGPQISELRRGAQIVVGTPGRVADLYSQRALNLEYVRFLVLDEADEMLDRGFAPQVNKILSWTPKTRQTALFSATMPEWVNDASHRHLRNPAQVAVAATAAESQQIDHIAYDVPSGGKIDALKDILDARGDGQVIVFGRTKHGVRKLAKQMEAAGYPVAALQGNLSQNARDAVMADFRAGKVPVLLATNVAARGIDVTAVDYVVNFELPESSELLSHRIGRTGRMGNHGQAITLLSDDDGAKWRQLERGLGKRIPRQPWTGARRTDSTPVIVEHESSDRRSQHMRSERSSSDRSRPAPRREQSSQQPRVENGRAPRPQPAERLQEPARPIQRRRPTISVIEEMKMERRAGTTPPPAAHRAEPEQQRPAPSRSRSDRPERSQSYGATNNGRGPRGPQTTVSTGRPSFGSRPVQRIEQGEDYEPVTISRNGRPEPGNERNRPQEFRQSNDRRPEMTRSAAPSDGETHVATCSTCGAKATLRFAPDLSRPVYCEACFAQRRRTRRPAPSAF
jgi:ATP-dependent RNA helicase DeaD